MVWASARVCAASVEAPATSNETSTLGVSKVCRLAVEPFTPAAIPKIATSSAGTLSMLPIATLNASCSVVPKVEKLHKIGVVGAAPSDVVGRCR